jgi:hypothetical protein
MPTAYLCVVFGRWKKSIFLEEKETVSVAVANFTQILFHSFLAYRIWNFHGFVFTYSYPVLHCISPRKSSSDIRSTYNTGRNTFTLLESLRERSFVVRVLADQRIQTTLSRLLISKEFSWEDTPRKRRGACPSATLTTINPTWTDEGANIGFCGERPANNCLSQGTVLSVQLVQACITASL